MTVSQIGTSGTKAQVSRTVAVQYAPSGPQYEQLYALAAQYVPLIFWNNRNQGDIITGSALVSSDFFALRAKPS